MSSLAGCSGLHVHKGYSDSGLDMGEPVVMTCMTTKQNFTVIDPEVYVLKNGRYAYKAPCPWPGKNGKNLVAFKFCSKEAYENHVRKQAPESEQKASAS